MEPLSETEWLLILHRKEPVANLNSAKVRCSALHGLPPTLRGQLWFYLSQGAGLAVCFSPHVYSHLQAICDPEIDDSIARDVYRTFPGMDMFREEQGYGQRALHNLLKAYSAYDRDIGYCQGMGFIAGLLIAEIPSEEQAFWTFVQVMKKYGWGNMFKYILLRNDTPKLVSLLKSLETQVRRRLPLIYAHFCSQEVQIAMPFTPYIMTIFSCATPHSMAIRVLDMFLIEGEHVLFILILRMLSLKQPFLLTLRGEVISTQHLYSYIRQKLVFDCFDEFSMQLLLTPLSQQMEDRELASYLATV